MEMRAVRGREEKRRRKGERRWSMRKGEEHEKRSIRKKGEVKRVGGKRVGCKK